MSSHTMLQIVFFMTEGLHTRTYNVSSNKCLFELSTENLAFWQQKKSLSCQNITWSRFLTSRHPVTTENLIFVKNVILLPEKSIETFCREPCNPTKPISM